MIHQPDWDALAELQFLLYDRVAGTLNEALSSIALSELPEARSKPPGYWQERASTKIANILNLFNAWSCLIRYKRGDTISEQTLRPFPVNALLKWLTQQLQLNVIPELPTNPLLKGNQETLQEALLMLHSVAYSQGRNVQITVDSNDLGAWFRIKFEVSRPLPATFDQLLASFGSHWREQSIAFELATARDFVQLNSSELKLVTTATEGEFVFFVPVSGGRELSSAQPQAQPAQAVPSEALLNILSPEMAALLGAATTPAASAPTPVLTPDPAPKPTPAAAPERPREPVTPADVPAAATPAAAVTIEQEDATPVLPDKHAPAPAPAVAPAPPTLAILRPLPPALSELQRRALQRDAAAQPADALEKPDPRAAQEATAQEVTASEVVAQESVQTESTVSDETDQAAADGAMIAPASRAERGSPEHSLAPPPAVMATGVWQDVPHAESTTDATKTQTDPESEAGERRAAAPDEPPAASKVTKGDA